MTVNMNKNAVMHQLGMLIYTNQGDKKPSYGTI